MYFTGGCRFISFFGGVCVFVFVDKIQMQIFLGVPLNGQTCVWEKLTAVLYCFGGHLFGHFLSQHVYPYAST